ncbi:MAG: hypothetical protein NTX03_10655 [Bacteroidetes bacterium]|nr:hypothetical protein [Bacteroidota bacterium]
MKNTLQLWIIIFALGLTYCKKSESTVPTTVTVTRIEINSHAALDTLGKIWDDTPDPGPDLFYMLREESGNVIASEKKLPFRDITTTQLPVGWNENILMPGLTQHYNIECFDDDGIGTPEGYMGGIRFKLKPPTDQKLPYTNTQVVEYGSLKFTLHLTWNK